MCYTKIMPIYTYACSVCDAEIEQMRPVDNRDELREHDDCGGPLLRGIDTPGAVWAPTSTGGSMKVG